ncbi:hypothetical protein GCM10010124_40330 [Pilimelia terevasa]|uniref:Uncharacterized protein n=1 Tax=Pilimelia terevasa TaxID=53372 RepID=A0A8J3BVT6_9ACTN|nr:hypothetical protein GCM10010124_40330 [Pilimelia terevasa]
MSVVLDGIVSDGARGKVGESMQRFADDLCAKMRDLERAQREPSAETAEYTASLTIKAEERLRRSTEGARRGKLDISLGLISPIFSGAAGIMGSYLNSVWQAGAFGAVAAVAALSTVAMVLRAKAT